MKISYFFKLAAVAALAVALATEVEAGPRKSKAREKILVQDEEEKYVLLTGSHIPQKVRRKSIGTDSMHNIRIYTKRELESTGRPTLAGALSIDPSVTISRGR